MCAQNLLLNTKDICHSYQDEKLSECELAEYYHCSASAIHYHLVKGNCARRSRVDALISSFKKGRHPNYKNGRIQSSKGYIFLSAKTHPRATANGYVFEHILVWERIHGRRLPEGWVIHHLNGIKDDNRPCNLIAMKRGAHTDLVIHWKKHIRELETEIQLLKTTLEKQQSIFYINEN